MTSLLDISDLSVVYKTRHGHAKAVDKVSFGLTKGQSMGLVGESGCGKSTIGAAIMGLLPASAILTSGRILFEGMDLLKADHHALLQVRWKKIAMVFQAAMNALNPLQRVVNQIIEAIRIHEPGCNREAARRRVEALYDQLSIPRERLDDYPHQYSGGMRQRAIIAMALACSPQIIIADEPTTALDVLVQDQILKTIANLQADRGLCILMISHDISLVANVCQHVGVLYAGQMVEMGTSREVFETPCHPYTQALLAANITLSDEKGAPHPISGKSPDIFDLPEGCRFYERCTCSGDTCSLEAPTLKQLSPTHSVLCCR